MGNRNVRWCGRCKKVLDVGPAFLVEVTSRQILPRLEPVDAPGDERNRFHDELCEDCNDFIFEWLRKEVSGEQPIGVDVKFAPSRPQVRSGRKP